LTADETDVDGSGNFSKNQQDMIPKQSIDANDLG